MQQEQLQALIEVLVNGFNTLDTKLTTINNNLLIGFECLSKDLNNGMTTLDNRMTTLNDGMATLNNRMTTLNDGMTTLNANLLHGFDELKTENGSLNNRLFECFEILTNRDKEIKTTLEDITRSSAKNHQLTSDQLLAVSTKIDNLNH